MLNCIWLDKDFNPLGKAYRPIYDLQFYDFDVALADNHFVITATDESCLYLGGVEVKEKNFQRFNIIKTKRRNELFPYVLSSLLGKNKIIYLLAIEGYGEKEKVVTTTFKLEKLY